MKNTADVKGVHKRLLTAFRTCKTKAIAWRLSQLRAVRRLVTENEQLLAEALNRDLGRCEFEGVVLDLLPLIAECDLILSELDSWIEPQPARVPSVMLPALAEIISEPKGVVLIISPFNYPLQLALSPIMGAIAAGCCVVFKPSEISSACEKVLAELIPRYLDTECIAVVRGGIDVSTSLLSDAHWDLIFFTGSTRVGKIVAKAAAESLTPVVLELGGMCPAVVDESCTESLELAAKRIVWGKFSNCGQTCIAPQFVLCHTKNYDAFVQHCATVLLEFYGKNPEASPDFARIINKASAQRLLSLLASVPVKTFVAGGTGNANECYVAPTIVRDCTFDSPLMREELFGPVLPIIKYSSIEEAIELMQTRIEKPLALYVFGRNRFNIDKFVDNVQSGGVVVNDTVMHCGNPHLPFGGVGHSGIGSYHGKYSFEAFSHKRAVLRKDDHALLDVTARYPPFSKLKLFVLRSGFKVPALPLLKDWLFPALLVGATWSLAKYYYTNKS